MQKIKFFNVNWTLKDKNLQQLDHLKLLKFEKIYILGKFQCISLINFFLDYLFIY